MNQPGDRIDWTLEPHKATPSSSVTEISGYSARVALAKLQISYLVHGALEEVNLPSIGSVSRGHELWQHTCFEAFLRVPGLTSYLEFNFSPSREWAAYQFSSYREGMKPIDGLDQPSIDVTSRDSVLVLSVSIDLRGLPELTHSDVWEFGASAVVESTADGLSFWALAHPPGKPDFHHSDCFVQQLAVSDST